MRLKTVFMFTSFMYKGYIMKTAKNCMSIKFEI